VDANGNVMFVESMGGTIRGIDPAGNLTTVISGLPQPFTAQVDSLGYYYLLDIGSKTITRYPPGPNTANGTVIASK
jgi:hypothetical protein